MLTPEETEGKVRSDVEGIDSHGYDLVNRMMRLDDLSVPEMDADYVFYHLEHGTRAYAEEASSGLGQCPG